MTGQRSFKERLHEGEHLIGASITFTDPCVTELMCGAGFDFLVIDTEHAAQDLETVQSHVMAMKGTNTTPIVRVPWNNHVMIKQVLDVGAAGVLVPMVKTEEDVQQAVSACMYPPRGIRGFGPRRPADYERHFKEYIEVANQNVVVLAQIEHVDAVTNIDKILKVPGLDGIFFGVCDLSGSLGLLGQTDHPRVLKAVEKVIARANQAGIAVGRGVGPNPEKALGWIDKGIQFVNIGADMSFLSRAVDRTVSQIRNSLKA